MKVEIIATSCRNRCEWGPSLKTLATLGLYVRPWIKTRYWEEAKAVGRFEGDAFDPVAWRPEYPNTAFDNMRPEDAFWAARIVSKFSDAAIRAIVEKARYSDRRATEYITAALIERRGPAPEGEDLRTGELQAGPHWIVS